MRKYFCFITIFLILPFLSKSADYDNEFWGSFTLDLPVYKDFEIGVSREIRLYNNWNDIKWHITDINLKYDFTKYFNLSFKYRYKYFNKEWQKVYYLSTYFKFKVRKIKIDYRLRLQKKNRFEQKTDYIRYKMDQDYIRNRILLEYDTDYWIKPYSGIELFYLLDNEKYSDRFSILRYYLGVAIDIAKKHNIELFYIYEREFNIKNPLTSNVIGINYKYKLPKLF